MNLVIIHRNNNSAPSTDNDLLRFGISNEPIASVIFDGLSKNLRLNGDTNAAVTIPEGWAVESPLTSPKIEHYGKHVPLSCEHLQLTKRNSWFVVSNGRFATQINSELLDKVLADTQADVVTVNVEPELLAYCEKVRLTAQSKVVGFRRLYSDSAEPAPIPDDWPHHLFIKTDILNKLLVDGGLPLAFSKFINSCSSNSLTVRSLNIAGTVSDLETEEGLLSFLAAGLNSSAHNYPNSNNKSQNQILGEKGIRISPG